MTIAEDNSGTRRGVAMTISVGLHALLILFLILHQIITPIPPDFDADEGSGGGRGVELALGMDLMGMGNGTGNSAPSQEESAPPPTPVEEATPLVNDVEDDNPAVKPTENKDKPKPTKTAEQIQAEKDQAFKDKLADAWKTHGTGEEGHGTTNQPGGEGVADGKPGGTGIGTGTGSYIGPGTRIDLPGYSVRNKPKINDKPNVGGRVVMDIWVDPDGKVTRASQNTGKSTTLDQNLVAIAKRACMATSFFPNPKATGEQHGTITFNFELE